MADLDVIQTHVDNIRYLLHRWGATKINAIDFLRAGKNQKKTSRRVYQTQQKEKMTTGSISSAFYLI